VVAHTPVLSALQWVSMDNSIVEVLKEERAKSQRLEAELKRTQQELRQVKNQLYMLVMQQQQQQQQRGGGNGLQYGGAMMMMMGMARGVPAMAAMQPPVVASQPPVVAPLVPVAPLPVPVAPPTQPEPAQTEQPFAGDLLGFTTSAPAPSPAAGAPTSSDEALLNFGHTEVLVAAEPSAATAPPGQPSAPAVAHATDGMSNLWASGAVAASAEDSDASVSSDGGEDLASPVTPPVTSPSSASSDKKKKKKKEADRGREAAPTSG